MSKPEDFGQYLFEKYPCIFSNPLWVECGVGWYGLVEELSSKINNYCDTITKKYNEKPLIDVVQIKEKYGGLRYYVHYHIDREDLTPVEALISEYESKSCDTCEDCGGTGRMTKPNGYWYRTLCEECLVKYNVEDKSNGK